MAGRFPIQVMSTPDLHKFLQGQRTDAIHSSSLSTSSILRCAMRHASCGKQLEHSYVGMCRRGQIVPPSPHHAGGELGCILSRIRQKPHLLVCAVRCSFEIRPQRQSCLPRHGDPCCCGCGYRPVADFTQLRPWPEPQDSCPERSRLFSRHV